MRTALDLSALSCAVGLDRRSERASVSMRRRRVQGSGVVGAELSPARLSGRFPLRAGQLCHIANSASRYASWRVLCTRHRGSRTWISWAGRLYWPLVVAATRPVRSSLQVAMHMWLANRSTFTAFQVAAMACEVSMFSFAFGGSGMGKDYAGGSRTLLTREFRWTKSAADLADNGMSPDEMSMRYSNRSRHAFTSLLIDRAALAVVAILVRPKDSARCPPLRFDRIARPTMLRPPGASA